MIRMTIRSSRLVLALVAGCWFLAPAARSATIKYLDTATNKEAVLRGVTITAEGPEGITVRERGKLRKLSALAIRDVAYSPEEVKPLDYTEWRTPFGKLDRAALKSTKENARPKLYKEALKAFAVLQANRALGPRSKLRRYVEFKAAETLFRLAQTDTTKQDDAVAALDKFCRAHADAWQIAPALLMLARIQEDKGDGAAVQKTYERLADVPGISDEIRATSLLNAARILLKNANFSGAETKLLRLKKALPPGSVYAGKVQIYLAQCQVLGTDAAKATIAEKQLLAMLRTSKDDSLVALIHNTLGDYYTKKNQPDDAFWHYLRVEVMYPGDRFEEARALYNLARLFREHRKDVDRADKCLEMLKDKRFAGLEFQKKAQRK